MKFSLRRGFPPNATIHYEEIFSNRTRIRNMTMLDPDDLSPGEIVFSQDEHDGKSMFGDIFSRKQTFGFSSNLTGLIVLCIVLTAVIVIFFGCYLMMRFMHRALSRDDSKDVMRNSNPYNNVVMHSKRVYEIQAEEGCFSGPPDPQEGAEIEDDHSQEPNNSSVYYEENEENSKVKRPETGDLKNIRGENFDDDPRAMLRKKQKVHKDSVCAFLFKPTPEPRMV